MLKYSIHELVNFSPSGEASRNEKSSQDGSHVSPPLNSRGRHTHWESVRNRNADEECSLYLPLSESSCNVPHSFTYSWRRRRSRRHHFSLRRCVSILLRWDIINWYRYTFVYFAYENLFGYQNFTPRREEGRKVFYALYMRSEFFLYRICTESLQQHFLYFNGY